MRWSRKRMRVEHALHELRRPLQTLALCRLPGQASWQVKHVLDALDDLEHALDGHPAGVELRPVALRELVEATAGRWASDVQIRWSAGEIRMLADPRRLTQALDNLIANAIEHGQSPVLVEATTCASGIRLRVRNRTARWEDLGEASTATRSASRGHGLRIVSAIVRAHGGRFLFDCSDAWAVGTIELPLSRRRHEAAFAS